MTKVKGIAILGLVKYIKKYSKEKGKSLEEIIKMMTPEDQKIFSQKILPSEWYPYSTYINLGNIIDRVFGRGDFTLAREIGKLSAQTDLKGIYRIFLSFFNPQQIVKKISTIWGSYYNKGTVEIKEYSPGKLIWHLKDFPEIGKFHCKNIEGWNEAFLELMGYKEAKSTETKCQSEGSSYCEFVLTWKE